MRRIRVLIQGMVQGVSFRKDIEEKAKRLGLKGYVRNVSQQVEVILEGEDQNVKKILEFCAVGPEKAKVIGIDLTEQKYQGEFKDFTIR
jgi:acylphosphatase